MKSLLKTIFEIQCPSRNKACGNLAIETILSTLTGKFKAVRMGNNLLVTKGRGLRPYYVAHIDQVHDFVPFFRLHLKKDVLTARDGNDEQCGVGGDDKCGIYSAIVAFNALPNASIVFVRDEEIGCLGSKEIPMDWFADAAFVMQSDRNNQSFDVISETNGMHCASDSFIKALLDLPSAHRHDEAKGSVTDIGELASRGVGVSCVNISSGYHAPHTSKESVNLIELEIATKLMIDAGRNMGAVKWTHKATPIYSAPIYRPMSGQDAWMGKYGTYATGYVQSFANKREDLIHDLVKYHKFDREWDMLDKLTFFELQALESKAIDQEIY